MAAGWFEKRFAAVDAYLASLQDPGAALARMTLAEIKRMAEAEISAGVWNSDG